MSWLVKYIVCGYLLQLPYKYVYVKLPSNITQYTIYIEPLSFVLPLGKREEVRE